LVSCSHGEREFCQETWGIGYKDGGLLLASTGFQLSEKRCFPTGRPTVEDEQGNHLGDAELPILNKYSDIFELY
jgi:hypothetical protein